MDSALGDTIGSYPDSAHIHSTKELYHRYIKEIQVHNGNGSHENLLANNKGKPYTTSASKLDSYTSADASSAASAPVPSVSARR